MWRAVEDEVDKARIAEIERKGIKQEEKDLIEIMIVEEMVLRRFYKYFKNVWEEWIREDANEKDIGLYHRSQRKVCYKKEEDISTVKNRKKGGLGVFKGSVEKVVYLTIKVTTDVTGVLCAKKR